MNLRNRCNRWTERNRCNRWIERNLRNLVLLTISCMILCGPALAWSEIPLQLPENPSQILDFMIPETGPFAGYPLLLAKIDAHTNLYWIPDPLHPVTVGSFVNEPPRDNSLFHRLTLDPAGNPILIEMSWGRCSFIKHESGCWHPRRSIPISGSEPCIGWSAPNTLQIDYLMDRDLYRATVNVNTWITESTRIEHGYSISYSNPHPPFWSYSEELTFTPEAVFIYLKSESRMEIRYGVMFSTETRLVSLIPESTYTASGSYPGPGFLVADWVSGDNWVAMYQFGDNPYRIKGAHSDIIDLGDLTAAGVDAAPDGVQYAAWADTGGTLYLMTSDADAWLPPEPVFTASPDTIELAVSISNKWILFQDDRTWRLIAENPAPAAPTPDPDPPPTFTPGPEAALLEIHLSRRLFYPYDEFRCSLWIRNPSTFNLDGMPVFVLLEVGDTLFFGPGFGTTPDNYLSFIPSIPLDLSMVQIIDSFIWPTGAGDMTGVRLIAAMTDPDVTEIVSNVDIVEFGWTSSY